MGAKKRGMAGRRDLSDMNSEFVSLVDALKRDIFRTVTDKLSSRSKVENGSGSVVQRMFETIQHIEHNRNMSVEEARRMSGLPSGILSRGIRERDTTISELEHKLAVARDLVASVIAHANLVQRQVMQQLQPVEGLVSPPRGTSQQNADSPDTIQKFLQESPQSLGGMRPSRQAYLSPTKLPPGRDENDALNAATNAIVTAAPAVVATIPRTDESLGGSGSRQQRRCRRSTHRGGGAKANLPVLPALTSQACNDMAPAHTGASRVLVRPEERQAASVASFEAMKGHRHPEMLVSTAAGTPAVAEKTTKHGVDQLAEHLGVADSERKTRLRETPAKRRRQLVKKRRSGGVSGIAGLAKRSMLNKADDGGGSTAIDRRLVVDTTVVSVRDDLQTTDGGAEADSIHSSNIAIVTSNGVNLTLQGNVSEAGSTFVSAHVPEAAGGKHADAAKLSGETKIPPSSNLTLTTAATVVPKCPSVTPATTGERPLLYQPPRSVLDAMDVNGVVRGEARQHLPGCVCGSCGEFLKQVAKDSKTSFVALKNDVSRHRYVDGHAPFTPDGFWQVGFSETQTQRSTASAGSIGGAHRGVGLGGGGDSEE